MTRVFRGPLRRRLAVLMGLSVLLLSACGGGSDSDELTPTTPAPTPPAISTQPANQSASSGSPVTFSVTATGTSPTYQWQSSADGTTWTNVDGATASTLRLNSVTLADDGRHFRASISNTTGSVTSSTATLAVTSTATFTALSSTMRVPRVSHAAVRLSDGKVLITGGFNGATSPTPALDTAELYDPTMKTFTALANTLQSVRCSHAATLLPDGRVLLTGGQHDSSDDGHDDAEIYDPTTQTFTAITARMTAPRGGHTAILLADGKVLIAGGFNNDSVALNSAELFDPGTLTFTALSATLSSRRSESAADRLPDGRVLLTGGGTLNTVHDTAEIYDPTTQAFTAIPAKMTTPREGHTATFTNGVLIVTGGGILDSANNGASTPLQSAEFFNPTTQVFKTLTAAMSSARFFHRATALQDGSVLLTGGANTANGSIVVLDSAEVYGP